MLCQGVKTSEYEIPLVDDAITYEWKLEPQTAGSVSGNGSLTSIIWNPEFKGTADLNVKALNNFGESPFSDVLSITIQKTPEVTFIQAQNPVCANQRELIYEVTQLKNVTYQWNIENGNIGSSTGNIATVNWNKLTKAETGKLTVTVTDNISGCVYVESISITISPNLAPDLNNIVAKTSISGKSYILIYPNPSSDFVYQWYKNDTPIAGANEQFYYPKNGLEAGEYKVYVSNQQSTSCGNFTKPYTLGSLERISGELFKVYPNPSNGYFSLTFNKDLIPDGTTATVSLFSLLGNKIAEHRINCSNNFVFNRNISNGTYLLKVETDNNFTETKHIIIK